MIDYSFIEHQMSKTIKRMLYWVDWYNSKSTETRKFDVGIFADFDKITFECKNTGIYRKDNMYPEVKWQHRFRIHCEGFVWDEDSLLLDIREKLKKSEIELRKEEINKDFKE